VLWLAMEYLSGPDLAGVAAAGPVRPGVACEYARQAADGLAHVHDRGVVHRDVKPANLMLDRAGRVKVLDVGLARPRWAGGGGLTKAGVVVGTPDYVAPEQVADARGAGPAADQYALGGTLYHLLTGRVPFPDGPPLAKVLARLTADPPPVDAVRAGLPAGLGGVVGRLLARRPEDRYPCMAAAAAALAAFATPAPTPSAAWDTAAELPAVFDSPTATDLPALRSPDA
jgi:serine/threonine protein kinase